MNGSLIIVSSETGGKFLEGTITDTSKPGTCMEIVPATTPIQGHHSYRACSRTAGLKGPIAVLLEDDLQGVVASGAYVAGTRGRLYMPLAGDDLNMLVGDIAGTSDTIAIGDGFGVLNTGKLHPDSSYASVPFQAQEAYTSALLADTLVWVKYLGNQA